MDPQIAIDLAAKHQWVAMATIVIGFLVRVSKADRLTRLPLVGRLLAKIPSNKRPYIAVVLGQVSGILDHVTMGTLWRDAVIGGVVATALAIMGHDVGIEGVRNGKEIGGGGKPNPSPGGVA